MNPISSRLSPSENFCYTAVFPADYPNAEELNKKIDEIGTLADSSTPHLEKATQRILEIAENQDRIKDFCEYVELGYTLVSGTLAHFIGNLLIYGSKYEILVKDFTHFGVDLQDKVDLGSSVVDGIFNTQRLIDILIRKHRLDFAKCLNRLIKEKCFHLNVSPQCQQILDSLTTCQKNLELFIVNEEKNLFEAQAHLGISATRSALSAVADFLKHFQVAGLIVAPFQWATSILGIASSSFSLHYTLKHHKIHQKWIETRQKGSLLFSQNSPSQILPEKTLHLVEALLKKRKEKFENIWNEWVACPSFVELHEKLSQAGIDLGSFGIATIENWQERIHEAPFKQELQASYLKNVSQDRQRANLIKELSIAKHCYQQKEVNFNTVKTKILFSVGLISTVSSVALTILVFFSIVALPGFILGFPALALFTATACLFLIGIHRMRTKRPIFFKNYFKYRIIYLFKLISTFFKQVKFNQLNHQILKDRKYILNKLSLPNPNLKKLEKKIQDYSLIFHKKTQLEETIERLESENQELYARLNCYRSIDFLNRQYKLDLKTHADVKNYLSDHLNDLFAPSSSSSRLIKTLYKDMGIQGFGELELKNSDQNKPKLIAAIIEFLGQSEEGLLTLIRNQQKKN